MPHGSFDYNFSNNWWCWASFHVLFGCVSIVTHSWTQGLLRTLFFFFPLWLDILFVFSFHCILWQVKATYSMPIFVDLLKLPLILQYDFFNPIILAKNGVKFWYFLNYTYSLHLNKITYRFVYCPLNLSSGLGKPLFLCFFYSIILLYQLWSFGKKFQHIL